MLSLESYREIEALLPAGPSPLEFPPDLRRESRPRRILLVADDEEVLTAVGHLVASFGHEVDLAPNGLEALERLEGEPDLVLLDGIMPGVDGFETARRIRRHPRGREVPILILTCPDTREERIRAMEAGANDFVSKPVDPTELWVRMRALLKLKDSQDELRRALDQVLWAHRQLQGAYEETVLRLPIAAKYRDEETPQHIQRVGAYSAALARAIARTHHERWDGSGSSRGLRGTEIPLAGRIVAIADGQDEEQESQGRERAGGRGVPPIPAFRDHHRRRFAPEKGLPWSC